MSEANGENEYTTGNPLVNAAFKRLQARHDACFKDIEDACCYRDSWEKKMSERIKEGAEYIASHEAAKREHVEWMLHFQAKLGALTNMMTRREGGPEALSPQCRGAGSYRRALLSFADL